MGILIYNSCDVAHNTGLQKLLSSSASKIHAESRMLRVTICMYIMYIINRGRREKEKFKTAAIGRVPIILNTYAIVQL